MASNVANDPLEEQKSTPFWKSANCVGLVIALTVIAVVLFHKPTADAGTHSTTHAASPAKTAAGKSAQEPAEKKEAANGKPESEKTNEENKKDHAEVEKFDDRSHEKAKFPVTLNPKLKSWEYQLSLAPMKKEDFEFMRRAQFEKLTAAAHNLLEFDRTYLNTQKVEYVHYRVPAPKFAEESLVKVEHTEEATDAKDKGKNRVIVKFSGLKDLNKVEEFNSTLTSNDGLELKVENDVHCKHDHLSYSIEREGLSGDIKKYSQFTHLKDLDQFVGGNVVKYAGLSPNTRIHKTFVVPDIVTSDLKCYIKVGVTKVPCSAEFNYQKRLNGMSKNEISVRVTRADINAAGAKVEDTLAVLKDVFIRFGAGSKDCPK